MLTTQSSYANGHSIQSIAIRATNSQSSITHMASYLYPLVVKCSELSSEEEMVLLWRSYHLLPRWDDCVSMCEIVDHTS